MEKKTTCSSEQPPSSRSQAMHLVRETMSMRRALLGLAACAAVSAASGALATTGLEGFFMTPACILGPEDWQNPRTCTEKHPGLREPLRAAYETWKSRNASALKEISAYCQRSLATLYRDLGIGPDGVERLRKAALRMSQIVPQDIDEGRCRDLMYEYERHSFTREELEKTRSFPLSLEFMEHIDPDFLKEPPAGVQANYQRDRNLHFARSYRRITALRAGRATLGANCLGHTVESCQREHGQRIGMAGELVRRERLPSGDERVTYAGSKMLFRGTFSENHPVGREERVFVLRPDGRIRDAWDRVQLLQRPDAPPNVPPNFAYSCEPFGRSNSTGYVLSVEP